MPRFVALLRGVSPMNLKMSELEQCVESAGFTGVKTLLSSGNVAFDAPKGAAAGLAQRIEGRLEQELGRSFPVTVRSAEHLRKLLESDPYQQFRLRPGAKRVVTFLWKSPHPKPALPMELDGATIHELRGMEALSSYVRTSKGPVFMKLIQSTFGTEQTTRTWETVMKCSVA